MSRTRLLSSPRATRERSPAVDLVAAAERMVDQIEGLVAELAAVRDDNDTLRSELHAAVSLMQRASASLDGDGLRRGRASVNGRRSGQRRRPAGRGGRPAKGRATPEGVTAEVVRAVLAKLGQGTAAEIAAEITRAGAPVSGRAVRFLAERAGAVATVGEDGQRRYRVG